MPTCCSAASRTTSPAPPTSPTCWCAAACARSRLIGVPAAPLDRMSTRWSSRSSRAPSRRRRRSRSRWRRSRWLQGRPAAGRSISSTARPSIRTPTGNIGPVADALLDALGADFTIACPAFPANGRTIYTRPSVRRRRAAVRVGHERPSADADDRRQSRARAAGADARKVGLVRYDTVAQGAEAVRARFAALRHDGIGYRHRRCDLRCGPLLHRRGLRRPAAGHGGLRCGLGLALRARRTPAASGRGHGCDCRARRVARRVVRQLLGRDQHPGRARCGRGTRPCARSAAAGGGATGGAARSLGWAAARVRSAPVLIYSTAPPHEVKAVQRELGAERAGALVEQTLAAIAVGLVAGGRPAHRRRRRDLGRGGAGARHSRPAHRPEIDPGVPWTRASAPGRSRWRSSPAISAARISSAKAWRNWSKGMQESTCASRSANSGRSLFDRGLTHGSTRQHQRRLRRRLAAHPDRLSSAGSTRRA